MLFLDFCATSGRIHNNIHDTTGSSNTKIRKPSRGFCLVQNNWIEKNFKDIYYKQTMFLGDVVAY
jgi:hypothetical protein